LQGQQDLSLPLVRELRAHIDAGDAVAARKAFEAVLAPLEAAVAKVGVGLGGHLPARLRSLHSLAC
jgi:hypothetical protein